MKSESERHDWKVILLLIFSKRLTSNRDRAIVGHVGGWGVVAPLDFFFLIFSMHLNIIFFQFVSIKLHFAPLNNIIDIFKSYKKKNISPTTPQNT